MNDANELTACLACGHEGLTKVLDLNNQPLANAFKEAAEDSEKYFPLAVNMCPHCHHLQLTHAVNPELIYKHYLYVSGTSTTYLEYMDWYAHFVREQFTRWTTNILDIGCNDGSQLDAFKKLGYKTYGVDPALNLLEISTGKGHDVRCAFWNDETADSFDTKFDIISSQNAFAHIPDLLNYLKTVKRVLADDGLMFISTSQADMILNDEFDTIYHEHIGFFNAQSMKCLAERAGLHLRDVVKTPIHGISYIFVLGKQPKEHRVKNILDMERASGLYTDQTYVDWAAKTLDLVHNLKQSVEEYRAQGYILGGYGAAAKGNTLLNFSQIKLDFIVDDNELKQNKFSPGMSIPVVSIEHLDHYDSNQKILFIPLAWNYFDDIRRKIVRRRSNPNDKFMKYFPKVEVQ